jgi:hypothetical protein
VIGDAKQRDDLDERIEVENAARLAACEEAATGQLIRCANCLTQKGTVETRCPFV